MTPTHYNTCNRRRASWALLTRMWVRRFTYLGYQLLSLLENDTHWLNKQTSGLRV